MGESNESERELVKAASEGNVGAFAELVGRYRVRVLRTAQGVLGSQDAAEDVAQDVFVRVWQTLGQYRGESSLATWLYRITVNASIDALRKQRAEVPLESASLAARARIEEIVVGRDERERVRRAVGALPPAAKAALILREYEQLSYKEIAEVLRVPIGTVMSRLNYARQVLKERLERDEEAEAA